LRRQRHGVSVFSVSVVKDQDGFGDDYGMRAAINNYEKLRLEYRKRFCEDYDPFKTDSKMVEWLAKYTLDRRA
jgi:hypothetical protein